MKYWIEDWSKILDHTRIPLTKLQMKKHWNILKIGKQMKDVVKELLDD